MDAQNLVKQSETEVQKTAETILLHQWKIQAPMMEEAVNPNELTSLTALISYVAYISGQNEFRIERQFADRFNIPNVSLLPSAQYDNAVRYLVDQVPEAVA